MGKRRKMGIDPNSTRRKQKEQPEDMTLDPSSRNFIYDDVDDFNESHEEAALKEVLFKVPKKVDKEQILGIGGSSSESDGASSDSEEDEDRLFMEDDIVDEKVETLPDERAWGKRKRVYFGTDTTDDKIKSTVRRGKTEEFSILEEAAARRLQERLDAQIHDLPDDDLLIQTTDNVKSNEKLQSTKLAVGVDISSLSEKQKKRLLKQSSPEFFYIVEDFQDKSRELTEVLEPLMKARKAGKLTHLNLNRYVYTRYQLISYYITNMCVYMMLKCELPSIGQHPVIARLTEYRNLIKKLDTVNNAMNERLLELVSLWKAGDQLDLPVDPSFERKKLKPKNRKLLNVLKGKRTTEQHTTADISSFLDEEEEENEQNSEINEDEHVLVNESQKGLSEDENIDTSEEEKDEDNDERRGITYKMSKNKGLLPSRRRDQQNPRVKYRMKYTKKLKLRKGQVRQVRKEEKRYTGEKSGINVRAVKSIKIK